MPGCQHHAGVLEDGELSEGAKLKFIKDVKDVMREGSKAIPVPFPCGPEVLPVPNADEIKLEDENLYPGFHEHWLGTYEKIALALDFQSQFMFAPVVMDPVALATKLGVDVPNLKFPDEFILYGTALPLLAIKLGFSLPTDLVKELPSIVVPSPPIPALPNVIPTIPGIDVDPGSLGDLALHLAWPLKLPDLISQLIVQMPSLFVGLLQFDFSAICDAAFGSGVFGPMSSPGNTVQVAAAKVLIRKTSECTAIAITGGSVGSSPGGLTGKMGEFFGYKPQPPPNFVDQDPRERIVKEAKSMDGAKWSKDKKALADAGGDIKSAELNYTGFTLPIMSGIDPDKKQKAFYRASEFSSCGLFIRGCYLRGGATDNYFTQEYKDSTAITGLLDIAKKKGAFIDFSSSKMPALKKGDAILVQQRGRPGTEHVLMITENYGGGFGGSAKGIEGGQVDKDNKSKPTAIASTTYTFSKSGGRVTAGKPGGMKRDILKIFDAEKMVKNV